MTSRLALLMIATATTVMLSFTFLRLPDNSLFWRALQNSGHGIVFAGLGAAFLTAMHLHLQNSLRKSIIISGGILFLLGAAIEVAQYATGRGASLTDVIMDSVGILSGSCLYGATHYFKRNKADWMRTVALLILGTVAMVWCIRWPVAYLIFQHQRPALPTLANFENVGAQLFVTGSESTQAVAIHNQWPQNSTHSVKVQFQHGQWPNVAFHEPVDDWSAYSRLMFSGYNPQTADITLRIRIDELKPGDSEQNRMTVRKTVPPGEFTVALNFDTFKANATKQGRTDETVFRHIDGFMVFLIGTDIEVDKQVVLYFDDFRLQ